MRRRRATVVTPGVWQCKTGGVRRLAVANGSNIFQMLLVLIIFYKIESSDITGTRLFTRQMHLLLPNQRKDTDKATGKDFS